MNVQMPFVPAEAPIGLRLRSPATGATAELRAKIWLTVVVWGSSYVVFTLLSLVDPVYPFWPSAAVRAGVMLAGAAFCFGLHRLLRLMENRSFVARAVTLAVAAPVVAEVFAWFNYFAFAWMHGAPLRFEVGDWSAAIRQMLLFTWLFIAWTGLYLAIEYSFLARAEGQRAADLQIHAHRAKLEALSNQINPHFLFNSLNSISALVLGGERKDADRALGLLSSYFRQTLCLDPVGDVPLSREIELHLVYLAMEQIRYPDMEVAVDLPDGLRDAAVPALILQPLIENAIRHGVARSRPPTQVRIEAEASGRQLILRVVNRGDVEEGAPKVEGHGIGLANVRGRLREIFGTNQSLETRSIDDGFEAVLAIPLEIRR